MLMQRTCHSIGFAIACVFALGTAAGSLAAQAPAVPVSELTVHAAKVVRLLPQFARNENTSIRFVPPPALSAMVEAEYGKPAVTRVWLPLDDMWDYRDNSYRFNFVIGQDRYANDTVKSKYDRGVVSESSVPYYEYLDASSAHSQYLMLNVRRYETEVNKGIIPMAKWKEVLKTGLTHYKKRYKNLRYIEALNEWHLARFGGLKDGEYYPFYKACYEVVNEINDELKPEIPLEIGGPTVYGYPLKLSDVNGEPKIKNKSLLLAHFLDQYAADPDPRKRLDFITFHDYGLGKNYAAIQEYQSIVRTMLRNAKLPENIPVYISEIGYALESPKPELNQHQATGISELFYYLRATPQLRPIPWVLFHEPARQLSLTAFVSDKTLSMTPFGNTLKMWSMQKDNEVETVWKSPRKGLNAVASKDGQTLVLQLWNDSPETASFVIGIDSLRQTLGKQVRFQEFRIDAKNNNVLLNPEGSKPTLTANRDESVSVEEKKSTVTLEPYSLLMWRFERAGK
jgi:hypothetical protein